MKRIFGDKALSVFIKPPSIQELERRLVGRGTDSAEAIAKRVGKASEELTYEGRFDRILINDNLEVALKEASDIVEDFIGR